MYPFCHRFLRRKRDFLQPAAVGSFPEPLSGLTRSPTGPLGYHAHNSYNVLGSKSEKKNLYSLYTVYTNLTKTLHTDGGAPDQVDYQHREGGEG